MNKKIILILIVFVLVLVIIIVGIGYLTSDTPTVSDKKTQDKQMIDNNFADIRKIGSSTEASMEILEIGKIVSVNGTENQDGSISAITIFIGSDFSSSTLGTVARAQNNPVLIGEIIEKDNESITIKLIEGGSKFIFYSDLTKVFKKE